MVDRLVMWEQGVWAAADSLQYYRSHRRDPDELYASERFFLPDLLNRVDSVLDVGCAAGGFSRIMRSFKPSLRYVGTDIIPEFVALAQRDYPECEFQLSDGIHFPFPPGSFDLVYCSGVLHVNSRFRDMVHAMWTQTKRFILCDFRLTDGPALTGEVEVNFGIDKPDRNVLPYQVLNVDELVAFLRSLVPTPVSILAKGYPHPVTATARVPLEKVIMAFFLLEKDGAGPLREELCFDCAP